MRVAVSTSEGDNHVIVHREHSHAFHAQIADFSLGGVKLSCMDETGTNPAACPELAEGERLYIERCSVEPYCQLLSNLEVHVVWCREDAVGCCFEQDGEGC